MRGWEILRFGLQRVFEAHLELASVYKLPSTTTAPSPTIAHLSPAISQPL
jgi:hypothetical protein